MISKKELLKSMGISYGQLYRWKREGLIPDNWFIKQSVSTGQETYFKKDLIIPRIKQILELKDQYQLEELKRMFNSSEDNTFSSRTAVLIDEINPFLLKSYLESRKDINLYELAMIYLLSKNEDIIDVFKYVKPNCFKELKYKYMTICMHNDENFLIYSNEDIYIDDSIKVIQKENIEDAISFIAKKMREE